MAILSKRQKREKDLKERAKKEQEKKLLDSKVKHMEEVKLIEKQATEIFEHQERVKETIDPKGCNFAFNFVSDRNGCGYFRSIFPYELLATYRPDRIVLNTFFPMRDSDILKNTRSLRFQRQATLPQRQMFDFYVQLKEKVGYKYKLIYEMDDLLMDIDPSNKIAYDFFDDEKKIHHLHMMRNCDRVSFSTENLKNTYINQFGVDPNKAVVVPNSLPQFLYQLPRKNPRDLTVEKPRVMWSGSGSHVGTNGDMTWMIELVTKTVDEYQWIFQGCYPPELQDLINQGKIESYPWAPIYGLANLQFYLCRPDITLGPLKPSLFNSCKSDLKYLESCALGAPFIGSSFIGTPWKSPYDESSKIAISNNIDEWKTIIDLLRNQDYYMNIVNEQYQFLQSRWMESKETLICFDDLMYKWTDVPEWANG